jgi:uncharacterized repeat protein (TIGR03803 family)
MVLAVVLVLGAAATQSAQAQKFTVLLSFDGADGGVSYAGLVQAADGNLYGTTNSGGANNYGTVFKITPEGTLTTLYSFCSQKNCTDGANPVAGLVQAKDGNFYGTTQGGGANPGYRAGTVFEITLDGILTTLYSFCSKTNCGDGGFPVAGLVQAKDGNFYGTTPRGEAGADKRGGGTVFEITPKGSLTTLYSFCSKADCADGRYPHAGLIQANDRDFYGTTSSGGAHRAGTVFEITAKGALTTLHSFCSKTNCADGRSPYAGLAQAADGDLYGTRPNMAAKTAAVTVPGRSLEPQQRAR